METTTYYAPLVFAALGGLAAIAGFFRGPDSQLSRLAGVSDMLWCGCALLVRSWILYDGIGGQRNEHVPWLDLGIIAGLLALLLLLPRLVRPWTALAIVAVASIWIWGDLLHFRFFGDVATLATLLAAGNGTELLESARALHQPGDWFLFLDLLPAAVLATVLTLRRRTAGEPRVLSPQVLVCLALLIPLTVPALVHARKLSLSPLSSIRSRVFVSANLVRQYGLAGFHVLDAAQNLEHLWKSAVIPGDELEEVTDWFVETAPQRSAGGPLAGIARGKNLIVLQIESLQSFAVDGDFGGLRATPQINRLAERALVFTDVTDQSGVGRTSDAELLALASLLPTPDRAAAFAHGGNRFVALPSILRDRGYTTLSAVPFTPSFWNRHITHPGYGFSDSLFRNNFRAGRNIGWGLNDRDFLSQMLDRLETLEQPFFSHLITLSLHFPYSDWPEEMRSLPDGIFEDVRLRNYLEAMHYLDQAVGEFFAGLEARGLRDDSVVVLYGDHDSGIQGKDIVRFFNFKGKRLNWNLFDVLPLMVWLPGDEAPHGRIDLTMGLSDLPVTLLALLGIDAAPFAMLGRNVLGEPRGRVLPRPQGHWIDPTHYYQTAPEACFARSDRRQRALEECADSLEEDRRQRFVSSRVLEYDLQEPLHETLLERLEATSSPGAQ